MTIFGCYYDMRIPFSRLPTLLLLVPPPDLVRAALRPHLREGAKIERSAGGAR